MIASRPRYFSIQYNVNFFHHITNNVPPQPSGMSSLLVQLVCEHLFALIVKRFLLCNNLLFIGGVCQRLGGRNHGDGSWSK